MRASKIVLGALVAVALPLCGLAEDAYIYWLIDQPLASAVTFDYARMVSSDFQTTYLTSDGGAPYVSADPDHVSMSEQIMKIGNDYGDKAFLIELFVYDSQSKTLNSVAQSGIFAFSDCLASISTIGNLDPSRTHTPPLKVSAFTIPEPTGGLLMLLGLAVLGLKRKRG